MKALGRMLMFMVCILGCSPLAMAIIDTSPVDRISPLAFTDVENTHENFDAISYVFDKSIVQGYEDGTYKPEQTINRAEFTKIIIGAQFSQSIIGDCMATIQSLPFTDIDTAAWYAPYVCVAYQNGIIGGYPDGTFRPTNEISFVEAAKILVVAFGYDVQIDGEGEWYLPYVEKLADRGAIPLTVTEFASIVERGTMAEMVYRLKERIKEKQSHTLESLTKPREITEFNGPKVYRPGIVITKLEDLTPEVLETLVEQGVRTITLHVSLRESFDVREQLQKTLQAIHSEGVQTVIVYQILSKECSYEDELSCWSSEAWPTDSFTGFNNAEFLLVLEDELTWLSKTFSSEDLTHVFIGGEVMQFLWGAPEFRVGLDVTLTSFMMTVNEFPDRPFIGVIFPLDVNTDDSEIITDYYKIVDTVGFSMFPSIVGELNKDEVWAHIDGWLNAAKVNTGGRKFSIVALGFPTQTPYGSEKMQELVAETAALYYKYYGDEIEMMNWSYLWDEERRTDAYFHHMGLWMIDGTIRPSFEAFFTNFQ